ncbi:DUF397 domain-containing protein [Actinokineospora sp. HUAS TT18]|uniref:DUF397 domain-containing protein n=1 Tax=Actinokineospora sp. HUAS TT18 TaxID=3447451 RepID=UPI003F524311
MSTTGRKATGTTRGRLREAIYNGGSQGRLRRGSASPDLTNIRDSKNANGPRLSVGTASWSVFLASVSGAPLDDVLG